MICSDFCIVELAIVPFAFYHSSIKQAVSVNIFLVFLDLFNKQKLLLYSNIALIHFCYKSATCDVLFQCYNFVKQKQIGIQNIKNTLEEWGWR